VAHTVADLLVERLCGWGIDTIFGLPGDGVNGIFEALRTRRDRIRFIQTRHEEAAAFAACGYAKFTGRLGVCLATSGPGGVHMLNGLYDAKLDGQPVLAITGHTYHDLIGTHFQQDVDLDKLFMDVADYNERVMGPSHVVNAVDEAVKVALGRRTVAHLTIPKDIQDWTTNDTDRSPMNVAGHSGQLFASPRPMPSDADLRRAAEVVDSGSRVVILAGRGAAGARSELLQLAERVGGVIVKPLLGKDVVPDDSPFTTGGIGLLGTAPSADALKGCDVLVIAGSSFPYNEFYPVPGQAQAIQIDLDATRIGLRYPIEVGLVGDCQAVLAALLPLVSAKSDRAFLQAAQSGMRDWNELMAKRGARQDLPTKPQVVATEVNRLLGDEAIVIADTGTVTTWAARHVSIRGGMRFSASGNLATMANGLPYAIGAAVAHPGRQVVALVGDGGLSMLMAELSTLVKYNLPVKVVVFKNDVLGQIKWEQIVFEGNPQFGVELQPIDFAAAAMACGVAGFTADRPDQVGAALEQAFSHQGPALVQCPIDANEPPMPGNVTVKQAYEFARAMARGEKDRLGIIKTVIENKVREVI
jgi:pyruvate dehydrogenase (quinone)